jgi:hypothetical protein
MSTHNKSLQRTLVNVAKIGIEFVFVPRSKPVLASLSAAEFSRSPAAYLLLL